MNLNYSLLNIIIKYILKTSYKFRTVAVTIGHQNKYLTIQHNLTFSKAHSDFIGNCGLNTNPLQDGFPFPGWIDIAIYICGTSQVGVLYTNISLTIKGVLLVETEFIARPQPAIRTHWTYKKCYCNNILIYILILKGFSVVFIAGNWVSTNRF